MSGITIQSQPSSDVAANGNNLFTVTNERAVPAGASFTGVSNSSSKVQLTGLSASHYIQAGDSLYVNFTSTYTDGYYEVITVGSTTATIDLTYSATTTGTATISNTNVRTIARIYKLDECRITETYSSGGSLSFIPANSNDYAVNDYFISYGFTTAANNVNTQVVSLGGSPFNEIVTGSAYTNVEQGYIGRYTPDNPDLILYLKDYNDTGIYNIDLKEIAKELVDNNFNLPTYTKTTGAYSDTDVNSTVNYVVSFSTLMDDYNYSAGVRTLNSVVEKTDDLIYSDVVRQHNIYADLSDYFCASGSSKSLLTTSDVNNVIRLRKGEKLNIGFYTDEFSVKLKYNTTLSSVVVVEDKRGYIVLDYDDLSAGTTYTVKLVNATDTADLSESYSVIVEDANVCNTIAVQFLNHLGSFDIYTFNKNRLKSNVKRELMRDTSNDITAFKNKTNRTAVLEGSIEHPLKLEALKDLYRLKDVYYIDTDGTTQIKSYIKTNEFIEFDKNLFIPNIELYLKNENESYD